MVEIGAAGPSGRKKDPSAIQGPHGTFVDRRMRSQAGFRTALDFPNPKIAGFHLQVGACNRYSFAVRRERKIKDPDGIAQKAGMATTTLVPSQPANSRFLALLVHQDAILRDREV